VAEIRRAPDLGVSFVRFANGVRLALRPSKLRANQVLVSVKVGNGRLDLPKDRVSAAWLSGALLAGGLKDLSFADMQQALAGKSWRANFGVGEDGLIFSGGTTPADIDTEMQVLAAYLRDPGYRPEAFEQLKSASVVRRRQADALPGGVLQREGPEILHAGDKRWASPSIADMQSASVEDVRALLAPAFADGAIDIIIVGDIEADKAIQAVAATFGALPPRRAPRAEVSADNGTHFPTGRIDPIKLEAPTQQDQSIVTISWPTHGRFPDLKDDATLQLLSAIMQDQLFAKLRGLGTVYSAQAGVSASRVFDYGYLQASAQIQPDKIDKFNTALDGIIADLQKNGPTADALERAKVPALQELARGEQTNDYWLSVLDGAQEDESRLDLARKYKAALSQVTAAQIRAAARKYLRPQSAIRLMAGPQAAAGQGEGAAPTKGAG
jgi:zinc protease